MTPRALSAHIPLPEYLRPIKASEQAISVGAGFDGAWDRSPKNIAGLAGWLNTTDPAHKAAPQPSATHATLQSHSSTPMLYLLAEVVKTPKLRLDGSFDAVVAIEVKGAR